MQLAYRRVGSGIPLVLLHGLYGSGDNWMTLANRLADTCEVWLPDLRNHGRSPHSSEHTYPAMAHDLHQFFQSHALVSPWILGHSMGGKVALHFASLFCDLPAGLIIADIAPVNYAALTESSEHVLEHLNSMNALSALDLNSALSRQAIEAQLAGYITHTALRRFLLKNLYRDAHREWTWRLNLEELKRALPHIVNGMDQFNPASLRSDMPLLFLKGGRSPYVGSAESDYIAHAFGGARIESCSEAGHWLHADAPEWIEAQIRAAINNRNFSSRII